MPTQTNLLGSGCPPLQCLASVGLFKGGLAATGAGQNSLATVSDFEVYTSGTAANGPTLPTQGNQCNAGDTFIKVNHSGNSMNVWPATGGAIANATVNTAFAVPNGKTCYFLNIGGNNWAASLSN